MVSRQETTYISGRGTLTLPAAIRRALGLKGKQPLLVEANDRGEIVLRPAVALPVEYYSDDRITEFASEEKQLPNGLKAKNCPGNEDFSQR